MAVLADNMHRNVGLYTGVFTLSLSITGVGHAAFWLSNIVSHLSSCFAGTGCNLSIHCHVDCTDIAGNYIHPCLNISMWCAHVFAILAISQPICYGTESYLTQM